MGLNLERERHIDVAFGLGEKYAFFTAPGLSPSRDFLMRKIVFQFYSGKLIYHFILFYLCEARGESREKKRDFFV